MLIIFILISNVKMDFEFSLQNLFRQNQDKKFHLPPKFCKQLGLILFNLPPLPLFPRLQSTLNNSQHKKVEKFTWLMLDLIMKCVETMVFLEFCGRWVICLAASICEYFTYDGFLLKRYSKC